jgi:methionyl-tRNA synthetase
MSEKQNEFYLTTPIYYVNARPHIGHAYSTIAADVIARRHRLLGDDTFFLTGTDEHGQKVQRSAAAAGIPPQQFTDEVSASFRNLWKRMGITNDDFIRTTEPRHIKGVQKLWRHLEDRGYIYVSTYTGQYSVGEEMFVEGPPGTIGPDGKPTETVTEENYFFKLSEFQKPLLDFYEQNPDFISPAGVRNEVLSFVRGNISQVATPSSGAVIPSKPSLESVIPSGAHSAESRNPRISPEAPQNSAESTIAYTASGTPYNPGALKDLSISRTTFDWGIPVPGNEKHVVYVWLDALINYITAIGYGSEDPADQEKFNKYWPADIHLVGKEITRFHCVYWPAFLMAAGLPLPKRVVANGWLLFEESKMSKSRGNIVRTETILDAFGTLVPKPAEGEELVKGTASAVPKEATEGAALAAEVRSPSKREQDLFAADVLRYFLLREIPFGQDGSFSFDALVQRYNSDLANGYGNLVSRTLSMIGKYFEGIVPHPLPGATAGAFIESGMQSAQLQMIMGLAALTDAEFTTYLQQISQIIAATDGFITSNAPWKLAAQTDEPSALRLRAVLYAAAELIRLITALLYPVLPYSTAQVWSQLGLGDIEEAARKGELKNLEWGGLKPGTKLGALAPIFPRAPKELIQLMTEMEANNTSTTPKPAEPPTEAPTPQPAAAAPTNNLQPATDNSSPQIAIDDFAKIDLRVAKVLVAERIPKADKLLRLEVDLGYEKRQILSGIAEWYTPEELIGRRIIIIANLAPRKMRGLESHGMLLAASHGENGKPILATFADTDEIELGSRLK